MGYGFWVWGWGLTGGVWLEFRERKFGGLFSHERRDTEMRADAESVQVGRAGVGDGGRGRDRTCNPGLRRSVLYPIELLARAQRGVGWRSSIDCSRAALGFKVFAAE